MRRGEASTCVHVVMRTAALTAISLHALTATSWALTTSLTAFSASRTHYTLCYTKTSPLSAPEMQHQRKRSE